MNNLEVLKAKKPENLKSLSSIAAGYVADNNTGGYYVVECGNCGEVFPSQQLDGGGAIADTGDYDDAYCPHCNAVDPDECYNAGLVWNVQQAKINALITALEAAQKESQQWYSVVEAAISDDAEWRKQSNTASEAIGYLTTGIVMLKERAEKAEAELLAANEKLSEHVVLPTGFILVPKKPTAGMIAAALECDDVAYDLEDDSIFCVRHNEIYTAMLSAVPHVAGFTAERE
ncbi:hypothetical protein ACRARQ_003777 [Yersinia enterocolitica]